MSKMWITLGLPGCGKSTWARHQLKLDGTAIRANRDDLRLMLHGGLPWSGKRERKVKMVQYAIIRTAMMNKTNVIVDDTNLHPGTLQGLKDLAVECKGKWEIKDFTKDVSIDTCIERDAKREGRAKVGHDVIRNMAWRAGLLKQEKPWIGVDLDGTVADISIRRELSTKDDGSIHWGKFFDPDNICLDEPRKDVIKMVNEEKENMGYEIIILSGRSDATKWATFHWLEKHGVKFDRVIMRPDNDHRKDDVLKLEFLDQLTDASKLVRIYDDRPQVIRAWKSRNIEVVDVGDGVEF